MIKNKILNLISFLLLIAVSCALLSCERPNDADSGDDGVPPVVPSGLRFYYAADGEIGIEWRNNSEPDLSGYAIYRKINGSDFKRILITQNDYYFDDSLNYDDEYSYRISAIDRYERESGLTATVTQKPVNKYRPQPPMSLQINARNWIGSRSINLNWEPNAETDVAGYNVYRGLSDNFLADSTSLVSFGVSPAYIDTNIAGFYIRYFYKIKAVDKGGLLSNETSTVSDQVHEIPEITFPQSGSSIPWFSEFKIRAIGVPAVYKIILQENEFFGELWSNTVTSSTVNDIISIPFSARNIQPNKKYYWRVVTYSVSSEPNSISGLNNFAIKE